ncbi:MAG: alpha/beta hydrolase, partial [Anaerolineales bacterium]|nr:alpha/beta hydrolase [Anaerolineales bacterium]
MNSWRSEYVTANKLKFHYTRTGGENKPPLVLMHGVTDDGLCWSTIAEALESEYDVIMVDARGHGPLGCAQARLRPGLSRERPCSDHQTIETKHPIILGHSMGAMSALTFAASYPKVPRAILLEDPPL